MNTLRRIEAAKSQFEFSKDTSLQKAKRSKLDVRSLRSFANDFFVLEINKNATYVSKSLVLAGIEQRLSLFAPNHHTEGVR